jgi:hypothetical protein
VCLAGDTNNDGSELHGLSGILNLEYPPLWGAVASGQLCDREGAGEIDMEGIQCDGVVVVVVSEHGGGISFW